MMLTARLGATALPEALGRQKLEAARHCKRRALVEEIRQRVSVHRAAQFVRQRPRRTHESFGVFSRCQFFGTRDCCGPSTG